MWIMASDDSDSEEIDLLVRELAAKRRVPLMATPAVSQPPAKDAPAQPVVPPPASAHRFALRPGSRWSDVRLLMPSRPAPGVGKRLEFGSAMTLPRTPDLSRVFSMPGPVALVRMWVGLGAMHGIAMAFWPYPKTYLWGLVLYLLSLGLVVLTGIWGARLSWEARLGAAHTIALGTVLWAIVLAAAEILPLV